MKSQSTVSRREFIKSGTAGASAAALAGLRFVTRPERVFGANDRVRVCVVGLHGQGWAHVNRYLKMSNVEVTALCDMDENVINQRLAEMEKNGWAKPKTFVDLRKALEDKSIDAVSIATPNHWHSLQAI